jgi:hypothetical protein
MPRTSTPAGTRHRGTASRDAPLTVARATERRPSAALMTHLTRHRTQLIVIVGTAVLSGTCVAIGFVIEVIARKLE